MTEQISTEENVLQQLKDNYIQIKKIVSNLETYFQKFETIKEKLDNSDNGLESKLSWSQTKKQEIENIYNEINGKIANISGKLSEIDVLLNNSQTIHQTIGEIKLKVEENSKNISENFDSSTKSKKQIDLLFANTQKNNEIIESKLQEINNILSEASTKIGEIKTFYDGFKKLQLEIENPETGVQSVIDYIEENKNQSDELINQIQDIRSKSDKELGLIEQNKKQSEILKNDIDLLLGQSKSEREEIANHLKIIIDMSFANSFDKREKELSDAGEIRKWVFIGSIVALLGLLLFLFRQYIGPKAEPIPERNAILYRITFSTPLLFLIAFAGKEYSRTKKEEEKYAFKSAISQAFPSHIKILLDKFKGNQKGEDVILKIVDKTYTTIYNTPYKDDNICEFEERLLNKSRDKALNSNNEKQKINFIDTIKQLKDLFADDKDLLKEAMGMLKPFKS